MLGIDLVKDRESKEGANDAAEEILDALSGNHCRCTGYVQIIASVRRAAALLREGGGGV